MPELRAINMALLSFELAEHPPKLQDVESIQDCIVKWKRQRLPGTQTALCESQNALSTGLAARDIAPYVKGGRPLFD